MCLTRHLVSFEHSELQFESIRGSFYEDFYVPFDVSFRARISDFSFWMSIRRQPAEIRLPQIEMQKVEMDLCFPGNCIRYYRFKIISTWYCTNSVDEISIEVNKYASFAKWCSAAQLPNIKTWIIFRRRGKPLFISTLGPKYRQEHIASCLGHSGPAGFSIMFSIDA